MTQTLPLTIELGSVYTGQAIGYRVLNLNRTSYSAFTTASVAETAVSGTYAVSGGIVAPDAGGYVIVGTAATDYRESVIEPVSGATGAGSGTGTYTDTITVDGVVTDGVRVQLSTDSGGSNRVYEAYTDALGVFLMHPDPGTYYRWLDLARAIFTQGVQVVVT